MVYTRAYPHDPDLFKIVLKGCGVLGKKVPASYLFKLET